jgi:hypothetical protein
MGMETGRLKEMALLMVKAKQRQRRTQMGRLMATQLVTWP